MWRFSVLSNSNTNCLLSNMSANFDSIPRKKVSVRLYSEISTIVWRKVESKNFQWPKNFVFDCTYGDWVLPFLMRTIAHCCFNTKIFIWNLKSVKNYFWRVMQQKLKWIEISNIKTWKIEFLSVTYCYGNLFPIKLFQRIVTKIVLSNYLEQTSITTKNIKTTFPFAIFFH